MPGVFRVASDGNDPRPIFDGPSFRPALQPSGAWVAFYFADSADKPRLGVCSVEGGPLLLDVPSNRPARGRGWSCGTRASASTQPGDRSNVWLLPAGSGPARKVTAWDDEFLFDFAVSRDVSTFTAVRVPRLRDAQRITGFEAALPAR